MRQLESGGRDPDSLWSRLEGRRWTGEGRCTNTAAREHGTGAVQHLFASGRPSRSMPQLLSSSFVMPAVGHNTAAENTPSIHTGSKPSRRRSWGQCFARRTRTFP
jgi:hypothetical protein